MENLFAGGGAARRARARPRGEVREARTGRLRGPGAHGMRRRRHQPQRDVREGVRGHVPSTRRQFFRAHRARRDEKGASRSSP